MTTMVYTQVEYEWDGIAEQYVVKSKEGYEYDGPIIMMKKAFKKLASSFVGKIVMAVAAYYTGGLLAGAMGVTSTGVAAGSFAANMGLSSAMASGLAYGATGAVAGGLTGGAQGALLGGIGGGLGGYYAGGGFDGLGGSSGTVGSAGATPAGVMGPDISLASPAVQAAQAAAPSAVVSGVGDLAGPMPDGSALTAGADVNVGGGFQNATTSGSTGVSGSLDASATGNAGLAGPTPSGYTLDATSQLQGAMPNGQTLSEYASTNAAYGDPASSGGFLDGVNFKGAGLELGKMALGQAMNPKPDMGAYNEYLDSMTQTNKETMAFNKDMATKKAAIGDQLSADALAMSPDYYAEQNRRRAAFADANRWQDQKAGLELRGVGAQGIQAEQNRNDLFSSLNQGSAYDQGWQTGMNSRNATYSTAGGMYGQMSYPTDNVGSGYGSVYNQWSQNNNAIGKGIEKVVDAGTSKNTGTQKTRDDLYNMGVR